MAPKPKTFHVGDRVTWQSQAAGSWTEKTGVVIEVVPPDRFPEKHATASCRDHESYVVEVVPPNKGAVPRRGLSSRPTPMSKSKKPRKAVRYWPRASTLRRFGRK